MQPVGVRFRPILADRTPADEIVGSARVDDVVRHGGETHIVDLEATESRRPFAVIGEPHGRLALLARACQPAVAEALRSAPSLPAKPLTGLRLLVPEELEEVPSKYPKPKRSKRHGRRP